MLKINKFEALGMGVSVALMALALFLVRFEDTFGGGVFGRSEVSPQSQTASVIVSENGMDGVASALDTAISGNRLEKMVVTDVLVGVGAAVKNGDEVRVDYIGTLQNGQEFDNTYKTGDSFSFTVGEGKVIAGWEEGVIGMKEGGKRILVIPPSMAYGKDGYGPIPGNATVVYAIELLEIK